MRIKQFRAKLVRVTSLEELFAILEEIRSTVAEGAILKSEDEK